MNDPIPDAMKAPESESPPAEPIDYHAIGARVRLREYERQLSLFEQSGVPATPTGTAPMNNHLARSPLFSPLKRGRRTTHHRAVLASQGDIELRYSGPSLDMRDEDVFLHAMHLAAGKKFYPETAEGAPPLEYLVQINRAQFLEALKMTKTGPNYRWLESSFFRLAAANIEIQQGPIRRSFHLIGNLVHNQETGEYAYYIPASTIAFFLDEAFGYVNMTRRLQLTASVEVAKWVQTFAVSHSKGPYAINIAKLKDLCGYTGRLRDFRIALSKALSELVRVGEFTSALIDERDIAHWVRNTESGRAARIQG